MGTLLIIIGVLFVVFLTYLNTVATVIVFKAPGSNTMLNIFRSLFIWLIPVIGFAFALRFTQQSCECKLHYASIPEFIRNWLYDDRLEPANPLADRRYGRSAWYGVAHLMNEIRGKRG